MVPLPHWYYADTKTSHSPSFPFEYSEKYHLTGFPFVIAVAISFQTKSVVQKAGI